MAKSTRRAPGEGGVYPYETKTMGTMYYYKCQIPDPATGGMKPDVKRGFKNKTEALKAMREVLAAVDKGTYVEPSKVTLGVYLNEWVDGLRKKPNTITKYRKTVRLHINPYLGSVPLASLTGPKLAAFYRRLEAEGRKDGQSGGLKASSVRFVHAMLHSALAEAVRAGLLVSNPANADKSNPPTAAEAKAPEMQTWTAEELSRFLAWSKQVNDSNYVLWFVAASTGCRRGELAALRWKDIDLDHGRISVRRTVIEIKERGKVRERREDTPKSHVSRVIDIDPGTAATLKAWRKQRGEISLALRAPDTLVFAGPGGDLRSLSPISAMWRSAVRRFNLTHQGAELPRIRLHDVRHTHASLLLAKGTPIKVVSERLGHSSITITLQCYVHVIPSMQKAAAETWGALIADAA